MTEKCDEIPGLTGLRGLAALSVLGFHFRFWGFGYGYLGVDVFFLLSGFILSYVYRDGVSAGPFLWARLARTGPTHLVATTAVGIAAMFWQQATWSGIVENLVGFGFVNPPTWSLQIEWYAYILFPVFASIPYLKRLPPILIIISGIVCSIVGMRGAINVFGPYLIMRSLGEFVVGVGLFRMGWQPRSWIWRGVLDCYLCRRLGDISYPLYLIHWLPLLIVTDGIEHPPTMVGKIVGVLLSICLAMILHCTAEEPGRRWLRTGRETYRTMRGEPHGHDCILRARYNVPPLSNACQRD
ncbi:MAG TPA: acyltransferase [Stellaceae bacterium]|jgi:peptidoglycan/LPS O-acetylase OafA/YrhL|nr:acyltransferase [Stellaceae bacterium]